MQVFGNIAYLKLTNICKKAIWSAGYKFVDKQGAKLIEFYKSKR